MVDGVPMNDMENGWVWSNWAGLDLVVRTTQVSRVSEPANWPFLPSVAPSTS